MSFSGKASVPRPQWRDILPPTKCAREGCDGLHEKGKETEVYIQRSGDKGELWRVELRERESLRNKLKRDG